MYVHATFAGITYLRFVRTEQDAQAVAQSITDAFGPIEVTITDTKAA
jgi:hypothetical protein